MEHNSVQYFVECVTSRLFSYNKKLFNKTRDWLKNWTSKTKLDMFSIKVKHYSQNHALNCIFGPPHGASGTIKLLDLNILNWNFQIKRLYCPLCLHKIAQKCNFVNNAKIGNCLWKRLLPKSTNVHVRMQISIRTLFSMTRNFRTQ